MSAESVKNRTTPAWKEHYSCENISVCRRISFKHSKRCRGYRCQLTAPVSRFWSWAPVTGCGEFCMISPCSSYHPFPWVFLSASLVSRHLNTMPLGRTVTLNIPSVSMCQCKMSWRVDPVRQWPPNHLSVWMCYTLETCAANNLYNWCKFNRQTQNTWSLVERQKMVSTPSHNPLTPGEQNVTAGIQGQSRQAYKQVLWSGTWTNTLETGWMPGWYRHLRLKLINMHRI